MSSAPEQSETSKPQAQATAATYLQKYRVLIIGILGIAAGAAGTSWESVTEYICPPCSEQGQAVSDQADPEAAEWFAPVAIITGPETAEAGRLIRLESAESVAQALQWDVLNLPHEQDSATCSDGQLLFVAAQPGVYQFRLWAASVNEQGLPVMTKATHQVRVTGETETVPETPEAPEKPTRPTEDQHGLASLASSLVDQHVQLSHRDRSGAVAAAYRSTASQSGLTFQEMSDQNVQNIRAAINDQDLHGWDLWYADISARLQQLEAQGKIKTPAQMQAAYRAIASGLSTVN